MTDATAAERQQHLARWTAERLGVATVELRPFLGGAANAGYQVFVDAADAQPTAFLRTRLGGGDTGNLGYSLHREGVILQVAARLGFPVAPVLGTLEQPDALLMQFVPGNARPDAAEIEMVAAKYLALIAKVHGSDASHFHVTQYATMGEAMRADFDAWCADAADSGVADRPLLALAERVLRDRMPTGDGPPSLVHGDVGAGNFLALDGEVSAMLDWELAHLGDPMEDLAWLWMRGAHTNFGDPETRFAEYEAASGHRIDRDRLTWQLALVMWKSVTALHARLRHVVPGELAMVQLIVSLTYDALLGAQVMRVLGGSTGLLQLSPVRTATTEANLADELLALAPLPGDQRAVLEYLRDSAALSEWLRQSLTDDCRTMLGIEPERLNEHIDVCPPAELLAVAGVVARDADRRAHTSQKAVRRIERAQKIGLGTA